MSNHHDQSSLFRFTNSGTGQRLLGSILFAQMHQSWHFIFGQGQLFAAKFSQSDVGYKMEMAKIKDVIFFISNYDETMMLTNFVCWFARHIVRSKCWLPWIYFWTLATDGDSQLKASWSTTPRVKLKEETRPWASQSGFSTDVLPQLGILLQLLMVVILSPMGNSQPFLNKRLKLGNQTL